MKKYHDFASFYPFYLSQHQHKYCRWLHYIGSVMAIIFMSSAVIYSNGWLVLAALINGYAFAWIGHLVFEKNRPATFNYPLYSLMGDWYMFFTAFIPRKPR